MLTLDIALKSDQIKKLGELARIRLSEEEIYQLTIDLQKILDYVYELKQVPTDGLPEIAQVTGLKNILRSDLPAAASAKEGEQTPEKLLEQVPDTKDGYIKVKAIFE